ncbi:MAG: hypothetical protein K0R50_1263 [Eubacterium sp.]|jgi:hypothetical protein|nr:hypothetical protein [Eubacterium sp.]
MNKFILTEVNNMKDNENEVFESLIVLLEKQPIDVALIETISRIYNSQDNFIMAASYVYNYGFIAGKRQERHKRK